MTQDMFFLMALIAGTAGGLVAAFAMLFALHVGLVEKPTAARDDAFLVQAVNCHVSFDTESGDYKTRLGIVPAEVSGGIVESWLDKRGLVMMPKGRDFRAGAKQ